MTYVKKLLLRVLRGQNLFLDRTATIIDVEKLKKFGTYKFSTEDKNKHMPFLKKDPFLRVFRVSKLVFGQSTHNN